MGLRNSTPIIPDDENQMEMDISTYNEIEVWGLW